MRFGLRRAFVSLAKYILAWTPYRLTRRGPLNRFQAIGETIASLRERGFRPSRIIDAGANTGEFTRLARRLFPEAVVHAIEPQPGCLPTLERLAQQGPGRLVLHHCALASPEFEGTELRLATDSRAVSTGAHVTFGEVPSDQRTLLVKASTLDRLVTPHLGTAESLLLKLDLQGFELEALAGSGAILAVTDVVLTEASFYAQAYEPSISCLVGFLASAGFELHDVASIGHRPRDNRARQADLLFVRRDSLLDLDRAWS